VHATDSTGLLVITQLQPISVIFSLPQDQLPQVNAKLHGGVQLTVDAYDRDDTAKLASGKLQTIDNQIDLTTGTYKLKSMFTNADNSLFPNQFVNVHLSLTRCTTSPLFPPRRFSAGPKALTSMRLRKIQLPRKRPQKYIRSPLRRRPATALA